ncbi:hypothetical protein M0802_012632 [Mischocyttarus mexicanus]|nr:hypothetical protein M0802_012632 [Mischocyttarus mexicanus]
MRRYGYSIGEGLGRNSDGIIEPISSIPRNFIAPVRPYNTRSKSNQIQLPSPSLKIPDKDVERPADTSNETSSLPPPPGPFLPQSSSLLPFLSLSPSPSPPQSPLSSPAPSPTPPESPPPSSSDSYDSDEPNPCAVPQPMDVTSLLKIVNSRDCIKNRKDNLVIFISYQGKPLDKGALELHENKMLPEYKDIMAKRAKETDLTRSKKLISLPIDYPPHKSDIINVLRPLFDVVTEIRIESFSIEKTLFMVGVGLLCLATGSDITSKVLIVFKYNGYLTYTSTTSPRDIGDCNLRQHQKRLRVKPNITNI